MSIADIEHRFTYHPPSPEKVSLHEEVRKILGSIAISLDVYLPPGRESALVQTKLEEAMFWANASIARNA
ncbi:Acb2/Tad1 domain-containing protein [Nocardia goodfellowii]